MKRMTRFVICLGLMLSLGSACTSGSRQQVRLSLDAWSSQHRLAAWRDYAIVISPTKAGTHQVRAYSSADGLAWQRKLDCANSDVLRDGLLCVGQQGLVALSGKDGGNLWSWNSPIEIRSVLYEGERVTLSSKSGERHTVDTSNGHAVAAGPVDARLFTSGGSLSVVESERMLRAFRTGNGALQWTVLPSLWPTHRVFLHHLFFRGIEPDGRHFLALANSETRLLQQRELDAIGQPLIAVQDTRHGVLVLQESTVTGLRTSETQRISRAETAQAWALGQTTIMAVETTGKGLDIVWSAAGRRQQGAMPNWRSNEGFLSREGATLHGAWLSPKKDLTHVEVRVRRWSPDLLYAWRTNGPWTARRISPEAEGDRGLYPAFDGQQPFSPMPLWFSPTMMRKLTETGEARVGRLSLTTLGWTYHRLALQVGKSSKQRYVSVPVMVVSRTDNDDRYWIAPNGANPLLLRAERDGGIFYLAGMSIPESLRR